MSLMKQKRWMLTLLTAIVLMTVPATIGHAINLMTNGDFETGDITGWGYDPGGQSVTWGASNTAGIPHSGTYGGYVSAYSGTASTLYIYNDASVANYPAGTTFKVKYWLKTTNLALYNGSGVGSAIQIYDAAWNSVGYCSGGGQFKGTHSYMPIEYCFELPANANLVRFLIVVSSGITAGSINFDDFSLTPLIGGTGNYVSNGSFESGLTGWVQWPVGGLTMTTTTNAPYAGSNCLQVSMDNTIDNGTAIQDLSGIDTLGWVPGEKLHFSAWVKTGAGMTSSNSDSLIKCYGNNGTPDGATYGAVANVTGIQSSWKFISGDFTHLSGYNWLRLYLSVGKGTMAAGTVYWDDAKLERYDNPGPTTTTTPLAQVLRDANNTPRLRIDGVAKAPLVYFSVPCMVLSDVVTKAANAGVNIVSVEMPLPWSGSNTGLIQQVLEANSNAKIILRVNIYPPSAWMTAHSDQLYRNDAGGLSTELSLPSLASDTYFNAVKQELETMIRFFHNTPAKDKIIGYHFAYLSGGEWFYPELSTAFWDYSTVNLTRFQSWCQTTYGTIGALNTAWGTAYGSFSNVAIPTTAQWQAGVDGVFRSPANGYRQASDYATYHNKMTADRVLELGQKVKDLTTSRSLTAVFNGYQNELIGNGSTRGMVHAGHLGLRQILASNAIDMICSPFSYNDRAEGGSAPMMGIVDAVMAAGKIWMQEDDMRTYLWSGGEANLKLDTETDTLNAIRRDFGDVLAHNQGTWWMDLVGNGNFNGQSMWDNITTCTASYNDSIATSQTAKPQIALIYDEDSPFWLKADSYNVSWANGYDQRSVFQSCGAQVGYYHIQDIPNLPSTVKLLVFVNTWRLSSAETTIINNAKSGNRTFLWMFAPGYVTETALSVTAINNLTGFTIAKYGTATAPRISVSNSGYPVTEGISGTLFGDTTAITPTFYVSSGADVNLGVYNGTARVGLALKYNTGWRSMFCGATELSIPVLRAIARDSGVNLLDCPDDLSTIVDSVNYNGRYLYLYGKATAWNRWLQLPTEEVGNTGFERFAGAFPTSGENCWTAPGTGISCSVSYATPHSGSCSCATGAFSSASGAYCSALQQKVLLEDATTYTIKAWVYADTLNVANAGGGDYIFLRFCPYAYTANARAMTIAAGTYTPLTNRTWTQYTLTYYHSKYSNQYPEMYINLLIYGRYSATNILIDDVTVQKQGSSTISTVTDSVSGQTVTNKNDTGWFCYVPTNGQAIYKIQ